MQWTSCWTYGKLRRQVSSVLVVVRFLRRWPAVAGRAVVGVSAVEWSSSSLMAALTRLRSWLLCGVRLLLPYAVVVVRTSNVKISNGLTADWGSLNEWVLLIGPGCEKLPAGKKVEDFPTRLPLL